MPLVSFGPHPQGGGSPVVGRGIDSPQVNLFGKKMSQKKAGNPKVPCSPDSPLWTSSYSADSITSDEACTSCLPYQTLLPLCTLIR